MQTDRMLVLSILGHEISCLLEEDNVSNKPYVRAYDGNAYDGDGRRVVCLERNPAIYTGILFRGGFDSQYPVFNQPRHFCHRKHHRRETSN